MCVCVYVMCEACQHCCLSAHRIIGLLKVGGGGPGLAAGEDSRQLVDSGGGQGWAGREFVCLKGKRGLWLKSGALICSL